MADVTTWSVDTSISAGRVTSNGRRRYGHHAVHHRLNGSSSPVLTATSLSYGETKNSTPHRFKTPDPIEIKFGTVDYVGERTRHAKFYANSFKGGFWANGWNIRKNFYLYIRFFSPAHPQVRPLKQFSRLIRQTTRFCTRTVSYTHLTLPTKRIV